MVIISGEKFDIVKMVFLKFWRSVKGKYFVFNIIVWVLVKVKKFEEGLVVKKGMILFGRVEVIFMGFKKFRNDLET